jgi:hypothetical protein
LAFEFTRSVSLSRRIDHLVLGTLSHLLHRSDQIKWQLALSGAYEHLDPEVVSSNDCKRCGLHAFEIYEDNVWPQVIFLCWLA